MRKKIYLIPWIWYGQWLIISQYDDFLRHFLFLSRTKPRGHGFKMSGATSRALSIITRSSFLRYTKFVESVNGATNTNNKQQNHKILSTFWFISLFEWKQLKVAANLMQMPNETELPLCWLFIQKSTLKYMWEHVRVKMKRFLEHKTLYHLIWNEPRLKLFQWPCHEFHFYIVFWIHLLW